MNVHTPSTPAARTAPATITPIRRRKAKKPLVKKDWTSVQPVPARADGTVRYGVPSAETVGRTYSLTRDEDGTLWCPCQGFRSHGTCWHVEACNEYEVERARAMWAQHEPARLVEFERELRGELYRMGDNPHWRVEIEYAVLVERLEAPSAA